MFFKVLNKFFPLRRFGNHYCTNAPLHIPVMLNQVVKVLEPRGEETYVDMTFGAGGHTKHILETVPNSKMIVLDRDPEAYKLAVDLSKKYPDRVIPLLGKFSELPHHLKELNIKYGTIDAFFFDLGCSSMQFDCSHRGFSISKDGPLDMRMDGGRDPEQPTAADVLAYADQGHIYKILKVYGEEKQAKKITNAIIQARYNIKSITTTHELDRIIQSCFESEFRHDKLGRPTSNATKTFQALRIFVNNELNELNYGIILADKYLKIGGKLITLSFHSLEDLIVKRHITGHTHDGNPHISPLRYTNFGLPSEEQTDPSTNTNWVSLSKHVMVPSQEEIEMNPRSRSAKMRAAIKVK